MASGNEQAEARLDRELLERLFMKLEKPIFNVVYRSLWNRSDAHEVTQEAFLQIWRARARVDAATVEPLLYRTALNLAANRRRWARLRDLVGLEFAEEKASDLTDRSGERSIEQKQTDAKVRAAIDALPAPLREVILLSEFSELSYAEIAAALKIPIGTVGSRRNSAMGKLQEMLGAIEGELR